jgi:hypothetical protein
VRALFLAAFFFAACDNAQVGAGGVCTSSEECGPGLLCDFGKMPHVCAGMSSTSTDLSIVITPPDDAAVDAATD